MIIIFSANLLLIGRAQRLPLSTKFFHWLIKRKEAASTVIYQMHVTFKKKGNKAQPRPAGAKLSCTFHLVIFGLIRIDYNGLLFKDGIFFLSFSLFKIH